MTATGDIERFVQDPGLLVDVCRDLVDTLDDGHDQVETAAMDAQLREIARAVHRLERLGVPVPDALRGEKTRLAAALAGPSQTAITLGQLADEFERLARDLRQRIERLAEPTNVKRQPVKGPRQPRTDKAVLRALIVEALRHLGGSARKAEILAFMARRLQGRLLPGDLERREATKDCVWENNACWERYQMTRDGILRTDSPRGVWELAEQPTDGSPA